MKIFRNLALAVLALGAVAVTSTATKAADYNSYVQEQADNESVDVQPVQYYTERRVYRPRREYRGYYEAPRPYYAPRRYYAPRPYIGPRLYFGNGRSHRRWGRGW